VELGTKHAIFTAVGHNLRLILAWLTILFCQILAAVWRTLAAHPTFKSGCYARWRTSMLDIIQSHAAGEDCTIYYTNCCHRY